MKVNLVLGSCSPEIKIILDSRFNFFITIIFENQCNSKAGIVLAESNAALKVKKALKVVKNDNFENRESKLNG